MTSYIIRCRHAGVGTSNTVESVHKTAKIWISSNDVIFRYLYWKCKRIRFYNTSIYDCSVEVSIIKAQSTFRLLTCGMTTCGMPGMHGILLAFTLPARKLIDRFVSNEHAINALTRIYLPNFIYLSLRVRHDKLPINFGRKKETKIYKKRPTT